MIDALRLFYMQSLVMNHSDRLSPVSLARNDSFQDNTPLRGSRANHGSEPSNTASGSSGTVVRSHNSIVVPCKDDSGGNDIYRSSCGVIYPPTAPRTYHENDAKALIVDINPRLLDSGEGLKFVRPSVQDIINGPGPSAIMGGACSGIRWIHLPANCMSWVEVRSTITPYGALLTRI